MYDEDQLLPISALQHLLFCPRQCVLIHIEQAWVENRLTAEGRIGHEKVDKGGAETRAGRKTVFGLPLRSLRLGLVGKADVVEFERDGDGNWIPFPVEHKHGRPKQKDCDRVQLCAQALCLEEMTGISVPEGALFYGKTRRREDVAFDDEIEAAYGGNSPAVARAYRGRPDTKGRVREKVRVLLAYRAVHAQNVDGQAIGGALPFHCR